MGRRKSYMPVNVGRGTVGRGTDTPAEAGPARLSCGPGTKRGLRQRQNAGHTCLSGRRQGKWRHKWRHGASAPEVIYRGQ